MALMRGAEPYLLPGGKQGVLVVHGFTGSPGEVKLLGEYLHTKGFTILGPRLCGHGTTVAEMAKTNRHEWYSSVEDGYHLLSGLCKEIAVVGLSMGGLLSLKLASEYKVSKVVSLSTPIYIADKRVPYIKLYSLIHQYVPKKQRKYKVPAEYLACYDQTPLRTVNEVSSLIREVQPLLPKIAVPLLVVQAKHEHTVRPESARYIYEHAGSKEKQLIWLEKSGHVVTLDIEREFVFEQVAQFLTDSSAKEQ